MSAMQTLKSEISEFEQVHDKLTTDFKDFRQILIQYRRDQAGLSTAIAKQDKEKNRLLGLISKYAKDKEINEAQSNHFRSLLGSKSNDMNEWKKTVPRTSPLFLRMVVGETSIHLIDSERIKFKQEYERFKLNLTVIFIIICCICIYYPARPIIALVHILAVYYYVCVTLRESILKVNGSTIRGWWITHHHISMIVSGTLALWPYGQVYSDFSRTFLYYFLWVSIVQVLQYRYQMQRLYTAQAMGKAHEMETVNNEFFARIHWTISMWFLLPFVFVGQVFQLYISWYMLNVVGTKFSSTPPPDFYHYSHELIVGICFAILGSGNIYTTLVTVRSKLKKDAESAKAAQDSTLSPTISVSSVGSRIIPALDPVQISRSPRKSSKNNSKKTN